MLKTIEFKNGRVVLIDQTLLPAKLKYIECNDVECVAEAIRSLRVRGAPAIGIAAAFAMAMTAFKNAGSSKSEVLHKLEKTGSLLKKTRPTAINLSWAVERVMEKAKKAENPANAAIKEALMMCREDMETNRLIGKHGALLIRNGDAVLTHCNAGTLATAGGFGTALEVIKAAKKQGKKIRVFADETRPLLQGARLTAFEMVQEKIPVTVITDSMAAYAMKNQKISKVVVGADRIAANGDTANKIGTYGIAILAKEHGIPFYVAAPLSTIDLKIRSGSGIPIEFRSKKEIEFLNGRRIVAEGADVLNPAFDVTPHEYIAAIVTEKGVLKPPFRTSIKKAFG